MSFALLRRQAHSCRQTPESPALLPLEESLDDGAGTPEDKHPTLEDRRTMEAVIDGLLLAHLAQLEPKGDGWLLRYPLSSAHLQEQQLGSFEVTLPIVGETRKDALMIAELVLRGHEPPEIPTQPATEPPPHAKFAMRRSIDPTRGQDRRRPADMKAYQLAEAPAVGNSALTGDTSGSPGAPATLCDN